MEAGGQTCIGARSQLAAVHEVVERFDLEVKCGTKQACIYLVPNACSVAVIYSRDDTECGKYCTVLVNECRTCRHRRVVARPGQRGKAAHALKQQILTRLLGLRAGRTVTCAGAVYYTWIYFLELLISQAKLVHNTGTEVFNDNVIAFVPYECVYCFTAFLRLEVDREVTLIAVCHEIKHTDTVLVGVASGPAALISAFTGFDLYHIRS